MATRPSRPSPWPVVVRDIAGDHARVTASVGPANDALRSLGFSCSAHEDGELSMPLASDDHRRQVFLALVACDAAFVDGAGWSPAEYARAYRDDMDPSLTFQVIAWRGPDDWRVSRE